MANLTNLRVKNLTEPGRYGDGHGLYLRVAPGGSKGWVQRIAVEGKRRDLGLGGYPKISLAKAREIAADNRRAVAEGRNPLTEKAEKAAEVWDNANFCPTFREATRTVHALNAAAFTSTKHAANWIQMVEKYTFPTLADKPLDTIDRADVLEILTPIWTSKQETARRVRQRMRAVFDWGVSFGHISSNPAGDVLNGALPKMPKVRAHFRALPYQEVADALRTIEGSQATLAAKLALRFTILTAGRSGETRGALWSEIDLDRKLWTIPPGRMKSARPHSVPLSDAAVAVLKRAEALKDGSGLVFPSPVREGRPVSDMTLTKILRATGLAERATVHGFRSAWRDWASENTNGSWAAMELSLAHSVGGDVVKSYARSDLLDQRRQLMESWAAFLIREA